MRFPGSGHQPDVRVLLVLTVTGDGVRLLRRLAGAAAFTAAVRRNKAEQAPSYATLQSPRFSSAIWSSFAKGLVS